MLDSFIWFFLLENDPINRGTKIGNFTPLLLLKQIAIPYPNDLLVIDPFAPSRRKETGSNKTRARSRSKTKSGNPILANDPHLSLDLPHFGFYAIDTPKITL